MKKTLLLFLFSGILHGITEAQIATTRSTPIYGFASLGSTGHGSWRKALELETRRGYSGSVYFYARRRESPLTPSDYGTILDFPGSTGGPEERLKMVGLTLGKSWWLGANSLTRFRLKAGATYNALTRPVRFRPAPPPTLLLAFTRYEVDWATARFPGFVFQPTLELALSRYFGFSVSWYTHHNKYWNFSGFEAAVLVGYLRDQRPRQN